MTILCPAKINTFLAVGPRDGRGYHPLRTIFQAVGLYDTLVVEPSQADAFFCDDPSVPAQNTVTRAWRLMKEIAPLPPLRVELRKQIPSESGLGGGSSDAAGFMRAAAALVGRTPSAPEFRAVALAVGADVPFFLLGGRARAEGYGEILEPVASSTAWFTIVRPPAGCSTGTMYQALDQQEFVWRDFPDDLDALYNDFERVAPCECLDAIGEMERRGAAAGLTGSGSAVFGRFANELEARKAANDWPEGYRTWAVPAIAGLPVVA